MVLLSPRIHSNWQKNLKITSRHRPFALFFFLSYGQRGKDGLCQQYTGQYFERNRVGKPFPLFAVPG
jgi:hypothetical protein